MSWPKPEPGLVIRYAYLWQREADQGRDEGSKDRPCAIVLTLLRESDTPPSPPVVRVLPITHSPPGNPDDAIEIPAATKQRLGLDAQRSWIILTEANDFIWPGPDLRPLANGDPATIAHGMLPPRFFAALREKLIARWRAGPSGSLKRLP